MNVEGREGGRKEGTELMDGCWEGVRMINVGRKGGRNERAELVDG